MMRMQDLIRAKRDGGELTDEQIEQVIAGVTDGSLPDYQLAALLMAVYWQGLTEAELSAWTRAMVESGDTVDLSAVPGLKVDKHSTGGVGDKVSICLAPLVAACGVPVPMISGRGLGHTGGTLDKLEAIPGFSTDISVERFTAAVADCGLSLIGQTATLAPADRKLYALRDVTGTVESIPLISSSIMSKKLAEGIDALVLDVKVGSGAFMKEIERARELARTLCGIGKRAGKRMAALITDMNQPLGRQVGNALETLEAIEVLQGDGPEDLVELTLALGAEMLLLGEAATSREEALERLGKARTDGSGLERLRRCVELQGGDPRTIDDPATHLPRAQHSRPITAERAGVLGAIQNEQIGIAAMVLGAGRERIDSQIDHAVGLTMSVRLGDSVAPGDLLATLHHNDATQVERAEGIFRAALRWADETPALPGLIYETVR